MEIDRRLLPDNPAVLRPQLADGLEVLGTALTAAGRPEEAAAARAESAALRAHPAEPGSARPVESDDPPPSDHHRWMLAATRAGVTLFTYLAGVDPQAHRPDLAEALEYVTAVPSFDRDGIPDREAVLPLWEELVEADLPAYGPRYAHALAVLSSLQSTAGLSEEAGRTEAERARVEALVAAAEQEREQERRRSRLAPRIPWGTPEEIDEEARRLTAAGDDAALWALALAVPVADGARLARALTDRGLPAEPAARALAERLAAAGRSGPARPAHRELPVVSTSGHGLHFAHGRPVLAVDGLQKNGSWALRTFDLTTGRPKVLHRGGPNEWSSLACPGPGLVVAVRELPGPPHARLLRLDGRSEEQLASGNALNGARVAATADGYVVGLTMMRAVLVGTDGDPPVPVDLGGTGLWRCDRLAVDPTGTRIALVDGRRTVLLDLPDGRVVAAADTEGDVHAVFLGPDLLVTAGSNGGLRRWELHGGRLRQSAAVGTPTLQPLFAVPAWRVVGGWALGRPHFHDAETLDPVPEPPATAALLDVTTAWQSSADGRYVVHGGSGSWPGSRTLLHDLHHPVAWLARPAAAVTAADLPVLAALAARAERRHRPLLRLLHDLAAHRLAPG
ncbi:hypothetical protein Kpho02_77210 [Kitasatospora phosalacinea]|uniref:Uncharacterized protein n=1 Tax=Kitasatospora phosalacinea TaxID=2065 RepID=A0A9W6V4E5_9ACTN|nr:hypothetical protein [Kitasatospora phosalacinea]GLW75424.1 hypothetical protein Kpho02_77210 [Kitasatospora phosalacinea]